MSHTFDRFRARTVAIEAALRAGARLRAFLDRDKGVQHKGEVDLVTQADIESQACVLETLLSVYPDHAILAEESVERALQERQSPWRWIIDPLDGTTNFVHGLPHFCVSIALEEAGNLVLGVVYDPIRDELFEALEGKGARVNGRPLRVSPCTGLDQALVVTGFPYDRRQNAQRYVPYVEAFLRVTQGVRRLGAAALDFAWVAAGRLDAYWEFKIKPWDAAAGVVLVREAGGVVTGHDDQLMSLDSRLFIASNPQLMPAMRQIIRAVEQQTGDVIS